MGPPPPRLRGSVPEHWMLVLRNTSFPPIRYQQSPLSRLQAGGSGVDEARIQGPVQASTSQSGSVEVSLEIVCSTGNTVTTKSFQLRQHEVQNLVWVLKNVILSENVGVPGMPFRLLPRRRYQERTRAGPLSPGYPRCLGWDRLTQNVLRED